MNRKHGLSRTKLHDVWCEMRRRCNNPKHKAYSHYGGRGITVDPRWDDFEVFLADMGECPEGHSLERVDVDGNYTPDNCIWADWSAQMRNRRIFFFNGNKAMRYIRRSHNRFRVYLHIKKGHPYCKYFDTLEEALEDRANTEMEREMYKRLGGR